MIGAGSTLWLMRYELLFGWRMRGKAAKWGPIIYLGFAIFIAACTVPLGFLLRKHPLPPNAIAAFITDIAVAFIFLVSISGSLTIIAASFVDRADLELLLSSPLPARRVLNARLFGLAINSVSLWLGLFSPAFIVLAIMAGPGWLGGIGLLISVGLVSVSTGLWLAVGLFTTLGPKRAKGVAQILAAAIGVSTGLVSASYNISLGRNAHNTSQVRGFFASLDHAAFLAPGAPLTLPARALTGDPVASLIIVVAALGVFLITTALLGPAFVAIAAKSRDHSGRKAKGAALKGFGEGGVIQALMAKEYRLLVRDPVLMGQVVARVLSFLPLLVIGIGRSGQTLVWPWAASVVTFMSAQFAGSMVWVMVSTENAPDLLACSPQDPRLLRRVKVAAATAPSLILVAVIAVAIAFSSWTAAAAMLAGGWASGLSSAFINVWWEKPVRRSEFRGRQQATWQAALGDLACGSLWGWSAFLLATTPLWAIVPLILVAGALALLYLLSPDGEAEEAKRTAAAA